MADDVTFTLNADSTPPDGTKAATDETTSGPHTVGAHMGVAKLAVSADGDSTHIPATVADGLLVEVSNPSAGGGTSMQDGDAFAQDVDDFTPIGGRSGIDSQVASGDAGVAQITPFRAVHVNLRNEAGTEIGSSTDDPVITTFGGISQPVSGTVAVSDVTPGTQATDLGKAEDALHTSGDVGVMGLAVRNDTISALSGDGDYTPLQLTFDALKTASRVWFNNAGGVPIPVSEQTGDSLPVKDKRAGTATTTQVADNASSTTLLAANSARLGCSVANDSSAVLFLKCGTTASATDYTVRIVQYGYWEAPANYTGRIDGIWATDPGDGAARITEFT